MKVKEIRKNISLMLRDRICVGLLITSLFACNATDTVTLNQTKQPLKAAGGTQNNSSSSSYCTSVPVFNYSVNGMNVSVAPYYWPDGPANNTFTATPINPRFGHGITVVSLENNTLYSNNNKGSRLEDFVVLSVRRTLKFV